MNVKANPYRSRWAVFSMSVPIFVEMALQMMVPNVDQFMLSRYSQDAVAAVGNDNVVFNMIVLTLAVMCQAATILIAHYRGAGDLTKVSEVCTVALASNFVLGAWLLGVHLGWGLVGIWVAMAADECTRGAVFLWRWHGGVWRKKLV